MRTMLLTAAAAVMLAAPASAQVYFDTGPGGVEVQVGPRYHRYYDRDYDRDWGRAYDWGRCRVIRSRIVRPDGSVVYRTRRICD